MIIDFYILALVSAICGVVFTFRITTYLSKRGVKINYWLLRLYILKYLRQYRKITIEDTGKPGNLFYGFVISMCLALVFTVIRLVTTLTNN